MISGAVNSNLEGIVSLTVVGSTTLQKRIEAVLDTGFTGYLTLPPSLIAELQLNWLGREEGVLADGRVDLFDVHRAQILWDGQPRSIEVESVDTQPLLGMAMLRQHRLCVDVIGGGTVTITSLL